MFQKNVLNHYLVYFSAFNGLKSAKNVMLFSFCIWVNMPMGGLQPPCPFPMATLLAALYQINIVHTKNCYSFCYHG